MPLPVLRFKDFSHQSRFQLWTDALTFRQMAREAPNNYLRSMSVRNTVLSAWTTLEMACCDALGLSEINRFKDDLKAAILIAGKTPINFDSGLWKRILEIRDLRNEYTHMVGTIGNRFPQVPIAEEAIVKIREAIHHIYGKIPKQTPVWIEFYTSSGWPSTGGIQITGNGTVLRAGVDFTMIDDPNVYKICLVTPTGDVTQSILLPAGTPRENIMDEVEQLLSRLSAPFTEIRVYQGPNLIQKEELDMRGY